MTVPLVMRARWYIFARKSPAVATFRQINFSVTTDRLKLILCKHEMLANRSSYGIPRVGHMKGKISKY